jgi:hypothetical protein
MMEKGKESEFPEGRGGGKGLEILRISEEPGVPPKKDGPPVPPNLEKHKIYEQQYQKNSLYWGLGIENEIYLEFDKKKRFTKEEFVKNHTRERYSVDYFSNYKKDYLDQAMKLVSKDVELPILLKSHSFSKTDVYNQPQTLCEKDAPPNPKYSGKTLLDILVERNPYFKDSYDVKWVFDGDTVEFPTRNFYNVNLKSVLAELKDVKKEFIDELNATLKKDNIFEYYGSVKIMDQNYPFATYMTNLSNIAMFNNGTLHYNITLPTELDESGKIKDYAKFVKEHSTACKWIQWMEPFFLAKYGSEDPFSKITHFYPEVQEYSSGASQRCAVSRYIGIGTYDTDAMEPGKILTKSIDKIQKPDQDWWFDRFYENASYIKLDEIGMDINFNKHFNHGIEIRFFDHLSKEDQIKESFANLIHLMDHALDKDVENPVKTPEWNDFVYKTMIHGKNYLMNEKEIAVYEKLFEVVLKSRNIILVFDEIFDSLAQKYTEIDVNCFGFGALQLFGGCKTIRKTGAFSMYCIN